MNVTVPRGAPRPEDVPVRDASTVMLLRDGDAGIEVCLVQRNLNSDFVGGAHVFPGGGVDDADGLPEIEALCHGLDDAEASRRLGTDRGGLAFWVAAIRESFEEAGVLLARGSDGSPLDLTSPDRASRYSSLRREVDEGRMSMVELAMGEGLNLDVGALHYFSRWITPLGSHRRYDTRFFVAAAPEGQEVTEDRRELIDAQWFTPAEALSRHDSGEIVLIFPTLRTLVALARFDRALDVVDHARTIAEVNAVLPTVTEAEDGTRIVLPGDPEGTGGVYDAWTGRPLGEAL